MMITDKKFVEAIRNTSLSRVQIAERLNISLPTVRRWRSGVNLPVHLMRQIIVADLRPYAKACT